MTEAEAHSKTKTSAAHQHLHCMQTCVNVPVLCVVAVSMAKMRRTRRRVMRFGPGWEGEVFACLEPRRRVHKPKSSVQNPAALPRGGEGGCVA